MTTLWATPDVEVAVVQAYQAVTDTHVGTKIPSERPDSCVRVRRQGGQDRNLVQTDVRLTVEAFAPDREQAFALAQLLHATARSWRWQTIASGVRVMRVQLTEPVNDPDPETSSPRYQFVAQLLTNLTPMEVQP